MQNTYDLRIPGWGGYLADNSGGPITYTSVTANYYVPCLAGEFDGYVSNWVGVGGYYNNNLVQTGTQEQRTQDVFGRWVDIDFAWVENTADTSNPMANYMFGVSCNDHMYVQVEDGNCMYITDSTNGDYSGRQCYGPYAIGTNAEGIVEPPLVSGKVPLLADFQSETMYDVDVGSGGVYLELGDWPHDYSTLLNPANGHLLISLGGIDSSGDYTMTWRLKD